MERLAKRGLALPSILREVITGLAAAALVHFISILSETPDLAIIFLGFVCLYFRRGLSEWREHNAAARATWTPELARSYRARAQSKRDFFRTARLLSMFVLFFCLAFLAATFTQGIALSDVSAILLVVLINLRNYLECADPADPDARSWHPKSASQGI